MSRPRLIGAAAAATFIAISIPLLLRSHRPVFAALSGPPAAHPATPVLVELFTSEGCSDCPPAEALLARLEHDQPVAGADIIALEEHVDYWDHLGWRDRFSSPDITARQGEYTQRLQLDDNYTPQMIVDGTDQFVGSDSARALRAIAKAARSPKPALNVSTPRLDGNQLNVSVSAATAMPPTADLVAALIETDASTQVAQGENKGRTLHHVAVVRELRRIGSAAQLTSPLFVSFPVPKDTPPDELRVTVFLQYSGQGAVVAAASSTAPAPSH